MSYSLEQLRQDINADYNVRGKTILDIDEDYEFVENGEPENLNTAHYVVKADTMVKNITPSGATFDNVVQARTLAMIDEDKGEIEFSDGLFGNFVDFDEQVADDLGVDTYEGSKIVNIDEIRESLVQISEEQYDTLLELINDDVEQYDVECDKILTQNGVGKSIAARFDNVLDEETTIDEDFEYER